MNTNAHSHTYKQTHSHTHQTPSLTHSSKTVSLTQIAIFIHTYITATPIYESNLKPYLLMSAFISDWGYRNLNRYVLSPLSVIPYSNHEVLEF